METYDILIRGAEVCDGEHGSFSADVGIRDGLIAEIGSLTGASAGEAVDGKGLCLLPGFIDVHTHTDLVRLIKPEREEALLQGVTTEITGACGIGCYPLLPTDAEYIESVAGLYGVHGEKFCFPGAAAYLDALDPCGVNTAIQVSHSPIRQRVCGFSDRPMTGKERDTARALLREAFEAGACALSTGLAYYPASFGDTGEAAMLASVAAEYDAPFTVHRRTALREWEKSFDNVEEVLDIAHRTGVKAVFSHHRTNYTNYGRPELVTEPVLRGRREGLNVTADFYPYPVGCGYIPVKLPMWVMDGGFAAIIRHLEDRETASRIAAELDAVPGIEDGQIVHAPKTPELVGLGYEAAAERLRMTVGEMIVWLLRENRLEAAYIPLRRNVPDEVFENDFAELLRNGYFVGGSDALPMLTLRHPRVTGTFPKLLRIAREHGIGMDTMANRLAALPAELYHLPKRGKIQVGYAADLVLFDKKTVRETSSFEAPEKKPQGIRRVIVNGKTAVNDGETTGVLAGIALRRG